MSHYNGARDYDPAVARYMESDPLGLAAGSHSTYVYVNDDPLSHDDPLGLSQYLGFPPDKEAAMKKAVEEAKRKVQNCKAHTHCFDDDGREQIIRNLDTTAYTYNPRFLGCGVSNTGMNQQGNKTAMGPAAFSFGSCCDLSSTLAHEANHLVGASGRSEDSSSNMALEFEWDDDKAAVNWQQHGVAFSEAIGAFADPFAVEHIDDRHHYGEERINLIGMCGGLLVHMTYMERDARIRIISARRAERHEQDDYYRENSA